MVILLESGQRTKNIMLKFSIFPQRSTSLQQTINQPHIKTQRIMA